MNMKDFEIQEDGPTCWIELREIPDRMRALRNLSPWGSPILFESAMSLPEVGRYSFLAADPIEVFQLERGETTDEAPLFFRERERLANLNRPTIPGLPTFQGGFAGLVCYETNRRLENIGGDSFRLFDFPDYKIGLYDSVVAWDHLKNRCWVIAQAIDNRNNHRDRLHQMVQRLFYDSNTDSDLPQDDKAKADAEFGLPQGFDRVPSIAGLFSNFSESQYLERVNQIIEYIYAGDIFQANFAQSLLAQPNTDSISLYERLRSCNPAPFSAYFDLGEQQVVSASPERLFSLRDGRVQTRPIKGTRRRTRFPEADLPTSLQLQTSEKDRAENIMIVDLLRNDLSKFCCDSSVEVKKLCGVESFRSVLHLVSVIEGSVQKSASPFDMLASLFPGGSITGAPKVRAMEIVSELETVARGPYCGCLGYIGLDGNADFNILIRTIAASSNYWNIPVGGGIVADSIAKREYEETWTKAAGMLNAIQLGQFSSEGASMNHTKAVRQ